MTEKPGDFGSAVLVLEDGRVFPGRNFGASGSAIGEVAVTSATAGFQEILTTPASRYRILVATAPQVGNTGWGDDAVSSDVHVAGLAIRDLSPRPSHYGSRSALAEALAAADVPGICDVDTRDLTLHLRDGGVLRAGIFAGSAVTSEAEMVAAVQAAPTLSEAAPVGSPAGFSGYDVPATPQRARVAVLNFGVKSSLLDALAERGIASTVVDAASTADQIAALDVDGVILSSGPGDPATADGAVAVAAELLRSKTPVFGVGLGHQILARALGCETYRLEHGHFGTSHPVQDTDTTRVLMTSHHHGYAVRVPGSTGADGSGSASADAPSFPSEFGPVTVTYLSTTDGAVEGLACRDVPAVSVQFAPEGSPGPRDGLVILDSFADVLAGATTAPKGNN